MTELRMPMVDGLDIRRSVTGTATFRSWWTTFQSTTASRRVQIPPGTLYRLMKKHDLSATVFRTS